MYDTIVSMVSGFTMEIGMSESMWSIWKIAETFMVELSADPVYRMGNVNIIYRICATSIGYVHRHGVFYFGCII